MRNTSRSFLIATVILAGTSLAAMAQMPQLGPTQARPEAGKTTPAAPRSGATTQKSWSESGKTTGSGGSMRRGDGDKDRDDVKRRDRDHDHKQQLFTPSQGR